VLEESFAERRRRATLTEAEEALVEREPGARRHLLGIAAGRGFGPRTRLRAVIAAIAPATARRTLLGRAESGESRLGRPGY
jgi:hypothetical protein